MPKVLFVCLLSLFFFACSGVLEKDYNSLENELIEKVLAKLSLEEKAGQLNLIPIEGEPTEEHLQMIRDGLVGSVLKSNGVSQNRRLQEIAVKESKNGIPILFQEDVIHGYKTIAPIPLAEAASWDLEAIQKSAGVAAREAAAAGIHLTYAPMVDICRDPRWGRIIEAAGEDPYLGSRIAAARVKGFQESNDSSFQNLLACVKHFVGYGASLAGRDYNIQDFSERELREIHLPPFQSAIDAGVVSMMCAYTAYDGIPLTANTYLMNDVLRGEMGFKGLMMTDWSTIPNLVKIGVAANDTLAAQLAFNAGIDMDMTSSVYVKLIPYMVKHGLISLKQVDDAVRQVLRLKMKAGLFTDPYAYFNDEREKRELFSELNYKQTKEMALKSMVLLKNKNHILPLSLKGQTIAVIGPFAKAKKDLMGWWWAMGDENQVTSIHDGIVNLAGVTGKVSYAKGCDIDSFRIAGLDKIPEAVTIAKKADVVVLVLGEEYWMSGEGGGIASLHLPGAQEALFDALTKTGKPIVTVIVSGRPYILTKIAEKSDALLQAWMPGTTGGDAVADILYGKFNPCGKLPVTFPYHQGQIPIYYNYRKTSHDFYGQDRYSTTYRDVQHEPLFPFGFGLSYTSYSYSDIELSNYTMHKGEVINASVNLTNTGKMKGREVVQLYIGDEICSVTRPIKELKGFQIVELEPGETKRVVFEIDETQLEFIDKNHQKAIESGVFKIHIGASSADVKETSFRYE